MTDLAPLRARPLQMRDGALADLATGEQLSPGLMRLVADADSVLSVIDRAATPPDAPVGGRLVVTHPGPGEPITVTIYHGAVSLARVELSPARALALGSDLIASARAELA